MPHPKRVLLRQTYKYACGYCGVKEVDVGGELTIDHYQPRSSGGSDDEQNLVYACVKCNQYKGNYWPGDEDVSLNRRVLHPLLDDISAHIIENEQNGQLEALSKTGKFHIDLLRLNRPQLIEYRLSRSIQNVMRSKQLLLEQQVEELKKTIDLQKRYIVMLEAQIEELI